MTKNITLDYSKAAGFFSEEELENIKAQVMLSHKLLHEKTGAGNDFLGWIDLPADYDKEEFSRIKKAADKIRSDSDVLIVIGIGVLILVQKQRLISYVVLFIIITQKLRLYLPVIV